MVRRYKKKPTKKNKTKKNQGVWNQCPVRDAEFPFSFPRLPPRKSSHGGIFRAGVTTLLSGISF